MANSTIIATYMPDGSVRFIISIGNGDPLSWAAYVQSKQDHGQGSGTFVGYPYFVEKFLGSGNQTIYKTYSQGNYVVELALLGIGVVNHSLFDVGTGGNGNGGGICKDPMNLGCTSGIPNTYLIGGAVLMMMMMKK